MSDIVPFGKHRGKPVEALLDDRPYLEWLLAQSWFKEKFGNVYNIVINNGQEPGETPEHNAMQIRFLEEEYRLKFAAAAHGSKIFRFTRSDVAKEKLEEIEKEERWRDYGLKPAHNKLITAPAPVFERDGIDVAFRVRTGIGLTCTYRPTAWPDVEFNCEFAIEIKPTVGDDYPVVLRQIQRNKSRYLLIRSYSGVGATREQFVQFFDSQYIKVIFEADVDAVILPTFDRKLAL